MTTLNEKYEREAAAQDAALNAIGGYDVYNRHVWEGWTVGDFIEDLKPELDLMVFLTFRPYFSFFPNTSAFFKSFNEPDLPYISTPPL